MLFLLKYQIHMAKVLWIIHNYPPYQNAGAEWMAKEINDYLGCHGHKIVIYASKITGYLNRTFDYETLINDWSEIVIEECDVIITHLDESYRATEIAVKYGKPIIHILHHSFEIPKLREPIPDCHIVYNSEWIQADRKYPHPSIVVRPPVNPDRFKDVQYNPDGYVTMVNCNVDKGIMVFQQIARSTPTKRFLAVKGHHGPQITTNTRNITQWECQEDIREVLKQTSILLIPSIYESYGRIGIEALACGIPVIAADTPGLRESLGPVGMFASRNFLQSWTTQLWSVKRDEAVLKQRAYDLWENSQKELHSLHLLIEKLCL